MRMERGNCWALEVKEGVKGEDWPDKLKKMGSIKHMSLSVQNCPHDGVSNTAHPIHLLEFKGQVTENQFQPGLVFLRNSRQREDAE